MDVLAAEASNEHAVLTLLAFAVAAFVAYLLACWIWSWARCGGEWLPRPQSCDAGRVYQNKRRRTFRHCRHCGGTGRRRRFGRTLWAHFIKAKRKAAG